MKKPYKYHKPKLDVIGWIPAIYPTRETIRNMNKVYQSQERLNRGMQLVLLESAGFLWELLKKFNIEVRHFKYLEHMQVGLLDLGKDGYGVALYTTELLELQTKGEDDDSLILFEIDPNSTNRMVRVLAKYQPWTLDLLPIKVEANNKEGYTPIKRYVPVESVQYHRERLLAIKSYIERDLNNAVPLGESTTYRIENDSKENADSGMAVDLMNAVVRLEFGIGGENKPHWRQSVKEMQQEMNKSNIKFIDYLLDGKEGRFNIPEYQDISESDLPVDNEFQKLIAQSIGLG